MVFPVPGGPVRRAPFGILAPISTYLSLFFKKSTNSVIYFLAPYIPATSLNLTLMSFVDSIFMLFLLEVRPFIMASGLILRKIQYVMARPMKGVDRKRVSKKASESWYWSATGFILTQVFGSWFYCTFYRPSKIRLGF